MKQSRNIYLSYIILIISSVSLFFIFHLNTIGHERIEAFLKTTTTKQKDIENAIANEIITTCDDPEDDDEIKNTVLPLPYSNNFINLNLHYANESDMFCQELIALNDRVVKSDRDQDKRMQSVRSNLRLLSYLNPILLLIIPVTFATWRTGNYIRLLSERKKIYIDSLTGTFNRRYLFETIDKSKPSHLVMLDLDGFKQINDKYGHLAGDQILIAFTHLLRQTLRNTDEIVRFGGDEFIILLHDMQLEDAKHFLTRLKFISHQYVKIGNRGRILLPSFSAGIVEYNGELESAIDRADAFVYQEKILNSKSR